MPQNIEIELKFKLHNTAEVAAFLAANAKFQYESFQHDVYYNPPHRDFLADQTNVYEWLRIRIEKDRAQLNYKDFQPHDNPVRTHCIEYETNVDSYEQLSHILDALNFVKLVDVKKTRRAWNFEDTEVSLDVVEGIGDYLEVEYKGQLSNIEEARAYLAKIVEKLGAKTGELEIRGYPFIVMEMQGLLK